MIHILQNYYGLQPELIHPITHGNINKTYHIQSHSKDYILQRMNPRTNPNTHHDIHAIIEYAQTKGLYLPKIIQTSNAQLYVQDNDNFVWRLQEYVAGHVHQKITNQELAYSAALLTSRFHTSVQDCEHTFLAQRPNVHNTEQHLNVLKTNIQNIHAHPAKKDVLIVAERIHQMHKALPKLPLRAHSIMHGDLKINNIIFDHSNNAITLIDLDTLARMSVLHELGDAFRSWCNAGTEDEGHTFFEFKYFQAAVLGYLEGSRDFITAEELQFLGYATQTIAMELSSRFAADALAESYFGWDPHRFETAWQHHLIRAQKQIELAESIHKQTNVIQSFLNSEALHLKN